MTVVEFEIFTKVNEKMKEIVLLHVPVILFFQISYLCPLRATYIKGMTGRHCSKILAN